jgi:hypothetical protein
MTAGFELDLVFSVSEIADGLRRLFAGHAYKWTGTSADQYVRFEVVLAPRRTVAEAAPFPEFRRTPTPFATRTLLIVWSDDGNAEDMEELRRRIARAFLRLMGERRVAFEHARECPTAALASDHGDRGAAVFGEKGLIAC